MKTLLAGILVTMTASGAMAGPDSDLLAKIGHLGTWAVDCTRAASNENPYVIFVPSKAGYPTRILKMESSIDRTSEIRNVRRLDDNKIKYWMMGSNELDNREITITIVGNRFRSIEAVDAKGTKYVIDGKTSKSETPWFQKCPG
jgi:hypothetical protein